mmetsp:Transcript_18172/g.36255  ORF Transcript_18172/g.36255 Transcript_18172/m.36255 type:complete len:118 (-) Transcript_18172:598-951(-)
MPRWDGVGKSSQESSPASDPARVVREDEALTSPLSPLQSFDGYQQEQEDQQYGEHGMSVLVATALERSQANVSRRTDQRTTKRRRYNWSSQRCNSVASGRSSKCRYGDHQRKMLIHR